MENHLYQCLYGVIRSDLRPADKLAAINRYKAKLVRHSSNKPRRSLLDLIQKDFLEGETPTIYQIIRSNQRRTARRITQITDETGATYTTRSSIAKAFLTALKEKYRPINVDDEAIGAILSEVTHVPPTIHKDTLEQPISGAELEAVMKQSSKRKAPGLDGLPLEFYLATWDTIKDDFVHTINNMFANQMTTPQQTRDIIVNLPKDLNPSAINDYRQITLLPTDYKLLARIVAQRMKQATSEQLQDTQYCVIADRRSRTPWQRCGT
jgi:hypothetical protein